MNQAVETFLEGHSLAFTIQETLAEVQSPFQKIGFYRTPSHGVLMMLDDTVMLTSRDEYVYHEMLTHLPLLSHPAPRRVLIIGGGDLGAVRECLRHPGVEEIHLCEIDGQVVELSRQHFAWADAAARDPRATITIGDGFELVQRPELANRYDVIMVDSSDAAGLQAQPQASKLFSETFFTLMRRPLAPGGIVCGQCESVFYNVPFIRANHADLRKEFREVHMYAATISTYPGGLWCFYFASDEVNPRQSFDAQRFAALRAQGSLRYYTRAMHQACFALPAELEDALAENST